MLVESPIGGLATSHVAMHQTAVLLPPLKRHGWLHRPSLAVHYLAAKPWKFNKPKMPLKIL
jgi:hypothetical protein